MQQWQGFLGRRAKIFTRKLGVRVKLLVKHLFSRMALEIRRVRPSSAPPKRTDMGGFLHHIKSFGFRPQTVIDVGVAHGTPALYETFPSARHVLIEPLEEFEPALKEIARKHKAEYVLAAASDHAGSTTIVVFDDLDSSSIQTRHESREVAGDRRQIPTVTLDQIRQDRQLRSPFLVKADVQGAELKVLDGATRTLEEAEVVILEASFFQFWDGAPAFAELIAYMDRRGFVLYDLFDGSTRPLDGALAYMDVAFVKRDGAFRQTHRFR